MKPQVRRGYMSWKWWVAADRWHGESVKTVQARLGHASATETPDTYSHLWPDSDDRTGEAVESVLLMDYLRTDAVV